MSQYIQGKLCLKCSIDLLRRALIKVMPEWEKHIHISDNCDLKIYGYNNKKIEDKSFHMMIPGPRNPDFAAAPNSSVYGDIGLRQEADKSWSVMSDSSDVGRIQKLEAQIKGEILRMKARAYARLNNAEILADVSNEEESYIDLSIDSNDAKKMLASV